MVNTAVVNNTALFFGSATAYVRLLGEIGDDHWQEPGLGSWSVRSLAGHSARAILTVENYLAQEEPGDVTIPTAEAYYSTAYFTFTDAAAVAARGVEAGLWLGDDPVAQVSAALTRATAAIESQPADRIVSIGGMGIRLDEYLRTRVFELVVHTIDLSRATGLPHALPDSALEDAVALAAALAARRGSGEDVLLALTGRAPLPEGFSVV
ncbi:MAG: maleylpyruvate isomerase family mycothiol-dependent enzyme [Actinomycetota bacterium]